MLFATAQDLPQSRPSPFRTSDTDPWPNIVLPIYKIIRMPIHPAFGWAVQKLGDVNGDGCGDFAVTTAFDTTFVFFGGPLLDSIPDLMLLGGGNTGTSGNRSYSITAGDMNGDGFPDIATSQSWDSAFGSRGHVRLYLHNKEKSIYDSAHTVSFYGKYKNSFLGDILVSGDVNGDGKTDLLMFGNDPGPSGFGVVYLYLGKEQPDTTEDHVFAIQMPAGINIVHIEQIIVADINGDGFDDILIQAGHKLIDGARMSWFIFLGNKDASYGESDKVIHLGTYSKYGLWFQGIDCVDINADGCMDIFEDGYNGFCNPRFVWGGKVLPDDFVGDTVIQNPNCTYFLPYNATQMGDMDGDGSRDYFITWCDYLINDGWANLFYRGGKDWNNKATACFAFIEVVSKFAIDPYDIGDVTGDGLSDVAVIAHDIGPPNGDPYFNGICIYRGAKYLDGVSPMSTDEIMDRSFKLNVFPNPIQKSSGRMTLDMNLPEAGLLDIRICDVFGREIFLKPFQVASAGAYVRQLVINFPCSGVYLMQTGITGHVTVRTLSVVE